MSLFKSIKARFWYWIDTRKITRLSMNPNRFSQRDRVLYRILEMVPGVFVWTTFILAIALSFIKPLWAVYAIVLFDLYWLFRITYFVVYLVIGWFLYQKEVRKPWHDLLTRKFPDYQKIYHIVSLPFYKEPYELVRQTILALTKVDYDLKRIIVLVAGEERAGEQGLATQQKLVDEFQTTFAEVLTTTHILKVGELAGKSANITFAAKKAQEFLDDQSIPYENVIFSSFDCDTVTHPEYFSCLTYHYLSEPNPTHASYQPLTFYNNNMWDSAWFTRVVANSTTFWLMTEFGRPDRLYTYSSHAIPFRALVDVGFWETDMVNEDSRIFIQCFIHYKGDYKVVPMYIPVMMDTVDAGNFFKTMKNQYRQVRRWGYSVEHFPYMVLYFFKDSTLPLRKKIKYFFNAVEGSYSWATMPILIFILGRLPLMVLSYQQSPNLALQKVPIILEWLMMFAMVGMVLSAFLNLTFLPTRPAKYSKFKYIGMVLQWLFLPLSMIVFGSIPAIDAQTRLMVGKYLGFWNTEKIRRA